MLCFCLFFPFVTTGGWHNPRLLWSGLKTLMCNNIPTHKTPIHWLLLSAWELNHLLFPTNWAALHFFSLSDSEKREQSFWLKRSSYVYLTRTKRQLLDVSYFLIYWYLVIQGLCANVVCYKTLSIIPYKYFIYCYWCTSQLRFCKDECIMIILPKKNIIG